MHYTEEQLAAFEKAISMFKGDMTEPCFNTWFAKLKLIAVTQDAIVLEAENAMVVEHLRSRYLWQLSSVLGAVMGRTYDIEIKTPEEIKQQYREMESSMLNPRYTFETSWWGPSNSFAHAAALAVADDPSGAYNPLFIYGGVGLGKTHLMNAIGNYIQQNYPRKNVLFITSETFTNELIDAIVKKRARPSCAPSCAMWMCFWWTTYSFSPKPWHAGGIFPHLQPPAHKTASRSSSPPTVRQRTFPPLRKGCARALNGG